MRIGPEALYAVLVAFDSAACLWRMIVAPLRGLHAKTCLDERPAKAVLVPAAAEPGHLLERLQQTGKVLHCGSSWMLLPLAIQSCTAPWPEF